MSIVGRLIIGIWGKLDMWTMIFPPTHKPKPDQICYNIPPCCFLPHIFPNCSRVHSEALKTIYSIKLNYLNLVQLSPSSSATHNTSASDGMASASTDTST